MATIADIGFAAAINILIALAFLVGFAVLKLQPINDRVYFSKWYLKGIRNNPPQAGIANKFVNLNLGSYLRFLNWIPAALSMPELELIEHAGLDSAVFLRIYLIGLKIFFPITVLSLFVLLPVNWTNKTPENSSQIEYSDIDELSISNIPTGSQRFWVHLGLLYVFTFWTCRILLKEYGIVAAMRLQFLAMEKRRPDQFTVIVRNVPSDLDETVSEFVEHFFLVNHPEYYLMHQVVYDAKKLSKLVEEKKNMDNWRDYYILKYERNRSKRPICKTGFWGLWGNKVDAIDFYTSKIDELSKDISTERKNIRNDPKKIMPAAFVSFRARWGAAVCAQTVQSKNPTSWLTEWAPEPRDVYWDNLAIPFVSHAMRRLIVAVAFFFLTFFYIIPISLVQYLANDEELERAAPFLEQLLEIGAVNPFIKGVLPGIILKIFLIILPSILMVMSKFEGFISLSSLQRSTASKYYIFLLVNVFLGSIITGAAFQQLDSFIHQSANEIPRTIGAVIPMKATFFITYIMIDGWAGITWEILRLSALIIFHLKNYFLVKTENDREAAMDPGSIQFCASEPRIQLYFLLGLVYAAVTPILLPFILVFFAMAYVVFRHQIINVYNQQYESAAAFWPDVHRRIITALVIAQMLLIGLLSTKQSVDLTTPAHIPLPVLTIWFHKYCKGRFESAFTTYPLQEARMKDTLERATEPLLDLRAYMLNAYVHPFFKDEKKNSSGVSTYREIERESALVSTSRQSLKNSPGSSKKFRGLV